MADVRLQLIIQAIDQAGTILKSVKSQVDSVGDAARAVGQRADEMGNRLKAGLDRAGEAAQEIGNRFGDIGSTLSEAGLALTGLGASMSAPFVLGVKAAGAYERQINTIKAVVDNITSEQLANVQKVTREIAATSQFGPTQVAEGMVQLAKAGYDAAQQTAAIGPVLQLAAAEGRRTGETAEDLVNILGAFGLGADGASLAADVLAKTSNETTTSMAELAQGLKFVGPLAKSIGMSFEEVNGYLGIFSNNGIKGAMAGTALRSIIARLSDPTNEAKTALASLNVEIVKSKDGNVDIAATFQKLHDAGMTGAQAMAIFGQESSSVATIIATQGDKIQELMEKNRNAQGSLKAFSDTVNSGLVASFDKFTSAIQRLLISFGAPFLDALTSGIQGISSFVNYLASFAEEHPRIAGFVGFLMGGLGVLITLFGAASIVAGGLVLGVGALTRAWQLLVQAKQAGIANTLQTVQALRQESQAITENTAAVEKQTQAQQKSGSKLSGSGRMAMGIGAAAVTAVTASASGADASTVALDAGLALAVVHIDKIISGIGALISYTASAFGKVFPLLTSLYASAASAVGSLASSAATALGGLTAAGLATVGAVGAAIGGVIAAGVVWIGGWRRDAKALEAEAEANAKKLLDKAGAAGFNPDVAPTAFKKEENQGTSSSQLIEMRKNETIALEGYLGKVEEARAKGDQAAVDSAYKNFQIQRRKLKGITDEILLRRENETAIKSEQTAMEQSPNIFTQAASKFLGFEERIKAVKDVQDTLNEAAKDYYAALNQASEIDLNYTRNQIVAESQSAEMAAVRIADAESKAASEKIDHARREFTEKKAFRESAYAANMAEMEKKLQAEKGNANEIEKILKQRQDIEKAYREQSKADEKALRDTVINEIKREQDAIKSLLETRRSLEQQIRDEAVASQKVQQSFTDKSLSEVDRLRSGLQQANDDLQRARDLMPSAPEKAIELAKSARQSFQSLAQDLYSLQQDLQKTKDRNTDILFELAKKQVSPADAWAMDLERVARLMDQAKALEGEGKLQEAQEVATTAVQKAQALAQAPEGIDSKAALRTATDYTTEAVILEERIKGKSVEEKKELTTQAEKGTQEASEIISEGWNKLLELNARQLETHQNQLKTLEEIREKLGGVEKPSENTVRESKTDTKTAESVVKLDQERLIKTAPFDEKKIEAPAVPSPIVPSPASAPAQEGMISTLAGIIPSLGGFMEQSLASMISSISETALSALSGLSAQTESSQMIRDQVGALGQVVQTLSGAVEKLSHAADKPNKLDVSIHTDRGGVSGAEVARAY
jgi:TP901 family phage tail tape measure protein